ncbi:MAG: signal recognition particle-docking protein FtsY [Clostridia bacterium]
MGLIKKISDALKKTKEAFLRKLEAILSKGELTDDFYEDLEDLLISSDVGVKATLEICEELRNSARKNKLRTAKDVKNELKKIIENILEIDESFKPEMPCTITVIGVNGVGKTTSIGKLASFFTKQKKQVILVAGDTFRAAAADQLSLWAEKSKTKIVKHTEGADASAVVFDGITSAKSKKADVLIIDTAGRLHTKLNLMEELKKISKITSREYPEAHHYTFIVLDATTGQNAVQQINAFNGIIPLDGIVLTKMDGTAKGGVVIAIKRETGVPVVFLGTGEKIEDLETFSAKDFADSLFD